MKTRATDEELEGPPEEDVRVLLQGPFHSRSRYNLALKTMAVWLEKTPKEKLPAILGRAERLQWEPSREAIALGIAELGLRHVDRFDPKELRNRVPLSNEEISLLHAYWRAERKLKSLAGGSTRMQQLKKDVWHATFGQDVHRALQRRRVLRDQNVLILGGTGTGKDLVAEAIMAGVITNGDAPISVRRNVTEFPKTLLETELFGHVKGAFSGATSDRKGAIEQANGGCLFLDEVADLRLGAQVKLLRVIESNMVRRVGAEDEKEVDVRYVCATSQPLTKKMERGEFRHDLFERLAGVVVRVPSLKELIDGDQRQEILRELGEQMFGTWEGHIPPEAEKFLKGDWARNYAWPGNVRELQSHLRSLILGQPFGEERVNQLSDGAQAPGDLESRDDAFLQKMLSGSAEDEEVKDWYRERVLESCGGNLTQAAKKLGLNRTTLHQWRKRP